MKGDESFRKKSKALLQSSNEVFVYKEVIPYFCKVSGVSENAWTAKVFLAECGKFPTLGGLLKQFSFWKI